VGRGGGGGSGDSKGVVARVVAVAVARLLWLWCLWWWFESKIDNESDKDSIFKGEEDILQGLVLLILYNSFDKCIWDIHNSAIPI
jgi:hypothetical protein